MLTVFPNLLDYALLAPLILRLGLGALLLIRGYDLVKLKEGNESWKAFWLRRVASEKISKVIYIHGIVQCVVGLAFIFGFYTQIAAIFTIVLSLIEWQQDNESGSAKDTNRKFSHLFPILISICLLFLGAGFLAIDLPL